MFGARLDDEKLLASEELVFGGPTVGSQERFKVQFLVNDRRGTLASSCLLLDRPSTGRSGMMRSTSSCAVKRR